MPTLQEYVSDAGNQSGVFDPQTGKFAFAPTREDASSVLGVDTAELDQRILDLEAQEADLKEKMSDARTPQLTPEQLGDGSYEQKGLSGQEMKDQAEGEAGITLEDLQKQLSAARRAREKAGSDAVARQYQEGKFLLSKGDGSWNIHVALPSELSTPAAKKFLSDLEALVGSVNIIANGVLYTLDRNTANTIDDFLAHITHQASLAFNSVSAMWRRKDGRGGMAWYG